MGEEDTEAKKRWGLMVQENKCRIKGVIWRANHNDCSKSTDAKVFGSRDATGGTQRNKPCIERRNYGHEKKR